MATGSLSPRFFSFALAMLLVAIFIAMLVSRIGRDFDQFEQSRFDYRLNELKAAVKLKQLSLYSDSRLAQAPDLDGANPFEWLQAAPLSKVVAQQRAKLDEQASDEPILNYLGEQNLLAFNGPPGSWFYEPVQRRIYYYSQAELRFNERLFEPNSCLAFQVQVQLREAEVVQLALVYLSEIQNDIWCVVSA